MRVLYLGGVCAAALAINTAVLAQQAPPQAQAGQQAAGEQQVTVTGCVQSEADYRRARDAGRGGVAGTGLGVKNEFVLVTASMAGKTGEPAPGRPTGTTGAETEYELTGANEGKAAQFVGQRVEIAGMLKAAEVAPSGRPTGGATAGKPPEGVDIASQDLKLRELEVGSIRQVSGNCPAQ